MPNALVTMPCPVLSLLSISLRISLVFVCGLTTTASAADIEAGMYYFDTRCSGCHGGNPAYIRRGASLQELNARATGATGHGGGQTPFNEVTIPDLAAYFSMLDTNQYSLTGVVVDAQGTGRPGVKITISSSYLSYAARETRTEEDGGFRFEGLPAGDHQTMAGAAGTNFNPPHVDLKALQAVNSGSALFVAYGTNEAIPATPPPQIIRVSPLGDDQTSGRAWAAAKRTIAGGLAACPTGGELWVTEGTYFEAILVQDQRLFGGFSGHETKREQRDWHQHVTIIDADPLHLAEIGLPPVTAVTLSSVTAAGAGCDGVTVQNGLGDLGGGIHVTQTSSAVIENCVVRANTSVDVGGGILCDQSTKVRVARNQVTGNHGLSGAAIFAAFDSIVEVTDNLLSGNSAVTTGALYSDGLIARMVNNTIVNNSSEDGSAVILEWDGSGTNANNIVAYNTAGIDTFANESSWNHNAVFGNTNFDWSNLSPGPSDVLSDPRFKNPDTGDFHLRPDSPCRDSGNDTLIDPADVDLDTLPRKSRRHVDLGAYELPPPRLSTSHDAAGLHLSWPGDETGFILEQTSGDGFSQWIPSASPQLIGGNWTITPSMTTRMVYFRLRQLF